MEGLPKAASATAAPLTSAQLRNRRALLSVADGLYVLPRPLHSLQQAGRQEGRKMRCSYQQATHCASHLTFSIKVHEKLRHHHDPQAFRSAKHGRQPRTHFPLHLVTTSKVWQ